MPPALPISSPALQILLWPCWGQGRSPGRAHESCQGPFVALFLPLLRVSGGVGRLSGLAEPGLEKFEHKFHGKPLAPCFPDRPLTAQAVCSLWAWVFHFPSISMCRALRGGAAHISTHVFVTQLCEVATPCTDENINVRKGYSASNVGL